MLLGAVDQDADQRVDHAVEGLVRHGLALVAAAEEDDRAVAWRPIVRTGVRAGTGLQLEARPHAGGAECRARPRTGAELAQEALDEAALAHARGPFDQDAARALLAHLGEDLAQRRELAGAAHERAAAEIERRLGEAGQLARVAGAEALHDLHAGRPPRGIARQQGHAQALEIRGDAVGEQARLQRLVGALGLEHLQHGALERQPLGQREVEEHAEGIPVDGRAGLAAARDLLRRHERGGADGGAAALERRGLLDLGDHAEIHEHHPALGGDAHVGGLEVAVDHVGRVQGIERARELTEGAAQAADIEDVVEHLAIARRRGQRRALADVAGQGQDRPGRQAGLIAEGNRRPTLASRVRHLDLRGHVAQAGPGRGVAPLAVQAAAAAHVGEEVDALDQLHGKEPLVTLGDQLVQRDDVGMAEVAQRAELALEAIQAHAIDAAQVLERHAHAALLVEDVIDVAHATFAQLIEHSETGCPSECHGRCLRESASRECDPRKVAHSAGDQQAGCDGHASPAGSLAVSWVLLA